jgi:hypothetical protein
MTTTSRHESVDSVDSSTTCSTIMMVWSLFRIVRWYELFIPINVGNIWRKHIDSDESINGKQIKNLMTQRFPSSMVCIFYLYFSMLI